VTIVARETVRRFSGERINTETIGLDGVVVEIAVIDAATGEVLLDALVNPDGVPVEDGARAVRGIPDDALAGAPPAGSTCCPGS
jgi:DNA polymerase III epsilon subunit-like protein